MNQHYPMDSQQNNPLASLVTPGKIAESQRDICSRIWERMNRFQHFTPLQEKAFFNEDVFWQSDRSLLIQGATSSGKTLVAEAAMMQARQNNQSVLYLAPLRAMITEKYHNFKNDFVTDVYASSRDHQINDTKLTNGNFNIAVVVYEKLYALLSQNNPMTMLNTCGLIILDEIQLLSDNERGMKIIMSLIKALEVRPDIRILGLTTTYCDMTEVQNWFRDHLHKELHVISNDLNALPLEEMVVDYEGHYRGRYVPSADDIANGKDLSAEAERLQTNIYDLSVLDKFENYGPMNPDPRLNNAVRKKAMLQQILALNKGRKIIVFCHSRRFCRELAGMIADDASLSGKSGPVDHDISVRLLSSGRGRISDELLNKLMPRGVAFHYSSLGQNIRSIIEDAFKKPAAGTDYVPLNILVATETLAIGVNLPADTIIVYDTQNQKKKIDVQTYKNYIGRAGRLMGGNDGSTVPRSYLLAMNGNEFHDYWSSFITASPTRITPAFKGLDADQAIPYFLSMLSSTEGKSIDGICETIKQNLPGVNDSIEDLRKYLNQTTGEKTAQREDARIWESAGLVQQAVTFSPFLDPDPELILTNFGKHIVPYALSVLTCAYIQHYYLSEPSYGLPQDVTSDQLKANRHLTDILFSLAYMPEISKKNFRINLNVNDTAVENNREKIAQQLRKYYTENSEKAQQHWPAIAAFLQKNNAWSDPNFLTVLLQTAVLEYWAQGNDLVNFTKDTGIEFAPEEGDVERLADIASYLLEAISSVIDKTSRRQNRSALKYALYCMSNRIKYGCSDECVRILNCHVPGVSRLAVIRINNDRLESDPHRSLSEYILKNDSIGNYLPLDCIGELRRELTERYSQKDFPTLVRTMMTDGLCYEELNSVLENILNAAQANILNTSYLKIKQFDDFLKALSNHHKAPFCLNKKSNNIYQAVWQNYRCNLILIRPESTALYNNSSFHSEFQHYLLQNPGRYILVYAPGTALDFTTLPRFYQQSSLSWIDTDEFYTLALHSLTDTTLCRSLLLHTLCCSTAGPLDSSSLQTIPAQWNTTGVSDIFLSYVHRSSSDLACSLYNNLTDGGRRVFLDAVGIEAGDKFTTILGNAIANARIYVLLFDENYAAEASPWTRQELEAIITSYTNNMKNKLIIPIIKNEAGFRSFNCHTFLQHIDYLGYTTLGDAGLAANLRSKIDGFLANSTGGF